MHSLPTLEKILVNTNVQYWNASFFENLAPSDSAPCFLLVDVDR